MPPPIPVELVPHSPAWADAADVEAERLRHVLQDCLVTVHHVGSTAIPGIHAKPILDLMSVVRSLNKLDAKEAALRELGYQTWGEYGIAGRRYCTLDDPTTDKRMIQLHCFAEGSSEIERHLAFRDYLRAHPQRALVYDREKQRCRDLHPHDSHAYSDAKSAWIARELDAALEFLRTSESPIDHPGRADYRSISSRHAPQQGTPVKFAAVGPIAVHFPEQLETNEQLHKEFPDWPMEEIAVKTGIHQRYIAGPDECSSDLGVKAAQKLFAENNVDPQSIDFLLLCTQTPDYPLPTTACLMQDRLGLSTNCGALDFNLGCSGFVYGLSLAEGLIRSGAAKKVLFITAETYSKFIHESDRSLRTIFSDAAAATLIEANDEQSLSAFQFGTDGRGADTLCVANHGFREQAIKTRGRHRWPSDLYMDGPSLISFTVAAVPQLVDNILAADGLQHDDVHLFLLHQATRKMLEQLQERLNVTGDRLPIRLEEYGNTVSCTLPILINDLRQSGELKRDLRNVLVGFGVGWSWAGCVWRDIWPR